MATSTQYEVEKKVEVRVVDQKRRWVNATVIGFHNKKLRVVKANTAVNKRTGSVKDCCRVI